MKNYRAYQGDRITVEWYYDENGRSSVLEYFKKLSLDKKDKLGYLMAMMNDRGKISDTRKFRYEGDCIFAFKVQQDRFFCFFERNSKIIITNAYKKKSQKMSQGEKRKALQARESYIDRYNRGVYYD